MARPAHSDNSMVVWGGTGFIGRNLVARLLKDGYDVRVIARRGAVPVFDCPVQPVISVVPPGDGLAERLALEIDSARVIYNLAGASGAAGSNSDLRGSLEGNCGIQAEFIRACEIAGSKPHVVFSSSRLVYGRPGATPVPESASADPISIYAAHKLCVEHYHRVAASRGLLTFTVCRISNPYGPVEERQHGYGFISNLIARGLRGEPLEVFGDGTQMRDYIHIADLSEALLRCALAPGAVNEVLNIGYGAGISVLDAARQIRSVTGAPIVHLPWPKEQALVESGDFVADTARARRLLGFEPHFDFASGLSDVVQAMRSKIPLPSCPVRNASELSIT